jgi:hypothetical protein
MTHPPVVHIGYPKAASTYLEAYLVGHRDVHVLHTRLPNFDVPSRPIALPDDGKVPVCINERIAEGVIEVGQKVVDKQTMLTPGAWDRVATDIRFDPEEMARRIGIQVPNARILMVVRNQAEWLDSAYRYFLPRLPDHRRTFDDFQQTPRGLIYSQAGHYDRTILAYAETFGLQNLCVVRFEDLRRSPDAFVAQVSAFLGVDVASKPAGVVNPSSSPVVTRIRRRLPYLERIPAPIKKLLRRGQGVMKSKSSTILSAEIRSSIDASFAESNRRTEDLLAQIAHESRLIPSMTQSKTS